MKTAFAMVLSLLVMAGCDASDDAKTVETAPPADTAATIDADPTPDTGTGGTQQTATPEGTVNGAPKGDQNTQSAPK
ncbi:hypothetical protein [Mesorhizobium sp. IMUNJ 23232]|uniref:hypothetical protein n=1 Tax=Mesorhizobium sp. IMUNJ 23232 TaxID=3376064 RepID=UPI0037A0BC81